MKNFKLRSGFDCLIVGDGIKQFLSQGETLILSDSCALSVYPTNKGALPFNINLASLETSAFYDSYNNGNDTYVFLQNGLKCNSYLLSTLRIGDDDCKIEIGASKVSFSYGQTKKEIDLCESFGKYKTGSMGDCAYCLLTNLDKQTLITFGCPGGKVQLIEGEEISVKPSSIEVTKAYNNIAGTIEKCSYNVIEGSLVKSNSSFNYRGGRATIVSVNQVVPCAFLEAIELGDIELASSYLSLAMRRRVDNLHLKEFFGSVKHFYDLQSDLYMVENEKGKSIFKFIVEEGKIQEIQDLS